MLPRFVVNGYAALKINPVIDHKYFPCQWAYLTCIGGYKVFYYMDAPYFGECPLMMDTKSSLSLTHSFAETPKPRPHISYSYWDRRFWEIPSASVGLSQSRLKSWFLMSAGSCWHCALTSNNLSPHALPHVSRHTFQKAESPNLQTSQTEWQGPDLSSCIKQTKMAKLYESTKT